MKNIKTILLSIIFIFPFVLNVSATDDDWQKDFQIDKDLGLIDKTWDIPLAKVKKQKDLTEKIKKRLPPYSQQPQKAQEISSSPVGAGGDSP